MGAQLFGAEAGSRLRHIFFFTILLVLLSSTPLTCNGFTWQMYQTTDLDALRAMWGAWNTSTPHPETNLAGWTSDRTKYPCSQEYSVDRHPNWRGLECLTYINCRYNTTEYPGNWSCNTFITRLFLNNASIGGFLPEEIGNITTLTTIAKLQTVGRLLHYRRTRCDSTQ